MNLQNTSSSGIYCIQNILNGKRYVGQTSRSFKERWSDHKTDYKINKRSRLYKSIRYHGLKNFNFFILEVVSDISLMNQREQYWMDFYQAYNRNFGYNTRIKAESNRGLKAWNKGLVGKYKHTDEWKENQSKIHTGRWCGEKSSNCKLTWKKVEEIRRLHREDKKSYSFLAEKFLVKISTIEYIIMNKSWKTKEWGKIYKSELEGNRLERFLLAVTKLTQESVEKIREEYLNTDMTCKKLSKKYGVSKTTIVEVIANKTWKNDDWGKKYEELAKKRNEEILRKRQKRESEKKEPHILLDWEKVKDIRELYSKEKKSQSNLAKIFNVTRTCIAAIIANRTWKDDEWGVQYEKLLSEIKNGIVRQSSLNWESIREIRKRYENGERISKISRDLNLSDGIIFHIVHNKTWKE